jgi:putative heme transporter
MSRISTYLRRNWQAVLTVITLLALAGLTVALWDQIVETFRNIDNVNMWALLLLIPLQTWYYDVSARFYRDMFRILGGEVGYKFLLRTSLELNFVNHVFPSGGVSGFSYWGLALRKQGVSAARATIVQTMRFVLLFISFQVLLFFALILLALDGRANNFMLLVSGSLATLLVLGTLALIFIVDSKKRIDSFFTFLTKTLNRVIQVVRPKHPETINIGRAKALFQDYHENYKILKQNFRQLRRPFVFSLLINLIEVLTIYAVFAAFGQWINLGAVIIAYAIANFAGLISVVPGGVGIYEGLMIGVLAAGGVSPAISLPVIIMYRVLMILLQIPFGGFLYYRTIHRKGE